MTDFTTTVLTLSAAGVDYIIVGGIAATLHGAARVTFAARRPGCRSTGMRRHLRAASTSH